MNLEGDIKLNGAERDPHTWPRLVSYVTQDFHSYKWQTVYETFYFVARIKHKNNDTVEDKIEELLNLLGLVSARDTFIAHISGGERVRVSIGLELLGNPSVMLLDEPLSGLDSFNALNILALLRKIASLGKSILITIHQPSYKMSEYFDTIMLMCQGTTVFEGDIKSCIRFFEECGFELPPNATPTDFFLDVLALDTRSDKAYEESQRRIRTIIREWRFLRQPREPGMTAHIRPPKGYSAGTRYVMLMTRSIQNYYRNISYLRVKIFQKLFVALIFGSTFYKTGVVGANLLAFRGILTFICQNELFGVSNPIMTTFVEEKRIISRERMSGLYSGPEAYLSKFVTELLFNLIYSLPCDLFVYMAVGFPFEFKRMLGFLTAVVSVVAYAVAWGLTISTIGSSAQAAHAMGVSFNVIFSLYSGAFSSPSSHPSLFRWLFWVSPIHYAFRAFLHNLLAGMKDVQGRDMQVKGASTLHQCGMEGFGLLPCVMMLFLFTAVLVGIGVTTLHMKTSNNLKLLNRHPLKP